MRTEGMDQVRAALKALSNNGENTVTAVMLAQSMGFETESQKQVMRRRVHTLIDRGEAEKAGYGEFRYIPGHEPSRRGESFIRIWKAIRIQTPGWRKQAIAALTRFDRTTIDKYVKWLEDEGFVERHGRTGNTTLWRTTAKGFAQRDTPWPPAGVTSPYEAENAAMGRLCTLMFTANLDQSQTRVKINKCLAVLTARFGSQDETADATDDATDDVMDSATDEQQGENHAE